MKTNFFFFFPFFILLTSQLKAQQDRIVLEGSQGSFVFTLAFLEGQDFMAIAPNEPGLEQTWEWQKELRFDASGELIKKVTGPNVRAYSVEHNGIRNFQVMGSGKVYAREVEVSLNQFPDYVFDNNYSLMSIDHLAHYIQNHKHLPNIPSAQEVEEHGLGLGELAKMELEKIEELSLYIIQLNDRIKALEAKLQGLENE